MGITNRTNHQLVQQIYKRKGQHHCSKGHK